MATTTGWLVVRADYSTITFPLELSVDATPPTEIVWQFDAGDGTGGSSSGSDRWLGWTRGDPLPPPRPDETHGGHVGAWFEVWTNLVAVCNAMIQHGLLDNGLRLLEVSFDNPSDVSMSQPPAAVGELFHDHGGFPVKRADVVSEVDEATIRATATV